MIPEPKDVWKTNNAGTHHKVLHLANLECEGLGLPVCVVFQSKNSGRIYTLSLRVFLKTMTKVHGKKVRMNCPSCGKLNWQYDPKEFQYCSDSGCELSEVSSNGKS